MVRHWLCNKQIPKPNDFQEKTILSIQYKLLDVLRPLLHSWSLQPSGSPASAGIESALRLLGAAFANVSKLQRANFMRNVASKLAPLLKDPRVFPSREYKRLFGSKFIEAMVKEVEDDA